MTSKTHRQYHQIKKLCILCLSSCCFPPGSELQIPFQLLKRLPLPVLTNLPLLANSSLIPGERSCCRRHLLLPVAFKTSPSIAMLISSVKSPQILKQLLMKTLYWSFSTALPKEWYKTYTECSFCPSKYFKGIMVKNVICWNSIALLANPSKYTHASW